MEETKETQDVRKFFEKALEIKNERGKNYDNGGKSAFERSISMYSSKNEVMVSTWPVVQKASRLITLAEELQDKDKMSQEEVHKLASSATDTSIDLVNYVAMQWVRNIQPLLDFNSEVSSDTDHTK
ncbi:hypothetical protein [Lactobacillus hominis]|uniref:Uncharacterized protein n=1 Tax=Lactobacillus hominis DSM 23910 = CRBIP 24.179 TaxID=1423758 RepID=I7L5T4_9LACO|nr:hypothetical protein [Lactobacillus hominis]KRM85850.1 hypothetical protein FC41_GL000038 [Lactobacillus hominis DSM 23910 = CRBIP 24.179]MCT3348912.1 hypothetical protein [Lactobacillus hominis]CCI81602.1 Protein of unknown function [Lactobacillus hominis DSM 23910 = CRBIP 24.179]